MKRKKYLSHTRKSKRKERFYKKRWFWNFALVLLLFLSFCWLIFRTPYFKIKEVKITGEAKLSNGVQNIIGENLNFFLVNASNLSQKIRQSFPKIENIKIRKEFPNKIIISIVEKRAVGLVCYQKRLDNCFLLASDGSIFEKATKEKNLSKFLIANLEKIKIGDVVMKEETIKNFIFLEKELKKLRVFIEKVYVLPYELEIKTKNGFTLFFSKNDSFKTQIEILLNAFQTAISKSEKENLEYIDLRGIQKDGRGQIYFR